MDVYFIDYDNLLDLADDMYHIFFGDPSDIDLADYIASFVEEEDAKDYVLWKNEDDGEDDEGDSSFDDNYDLDPIDEEEEDSLWGAN